MTNTEVPRSLKRIANYFADRIDDLEGRLGAIENRLEIIADDAEIIHSARSDIAELEAAIERLAELVERALTLGVVAHDGTVKRRQKKRSNPLTKR